MTGFRYHALALTTSVVTLAVGVVVGVGPLSEAQTSKQQDQVAALRLAGVAADTINSSIERDANIAAWRRVAAGQTRLLYLAPEMTARSPRHSPDRSPPTGSRDGPWSSSRHPVRTGRSYAEPWRTSKRRVPR